MKMPSKCELMAVLLLSTIISLCLTCTITIIEWPDTDPARLVTDHSTDSTQSVDQDSTSPTFQAPSSPLMQEDFYQQICPQAEAIILDIMKMTSPENSNSTAQLLRQMFHACFTQELDLLMMARE